MIKVIRVSKKGWFKTLIPCRLYTSSFAQATREYIEAGKDLRGKGYDPRKLLAPGAEAIKNTVKEKIELFGSKDRA